MNAAPLVLYHSDCDDGFCAAWIARKALGPDTECVPVQHGNPPPDVTGRKVYVLDFSYPREVLIDMKAKAASLVVIDHHKTAQQDLAGLPFCIFDLNHSGSMLAWRYFDGEHIEYFAGSLHFNEEAPWLIRYVEDRDLWRWSLPYSKEVSAALRSYPRTFEAWGRLFNEEGGEANLVQDGRAILRAQDILVGQICSGAREILFCDHRVLGVHANVLQSEIGERLSEGRPFSLTWFQTKEGQWVYSLRSRPPHGIDCSVVAKQFSGGGHPGAAGFRGPPPEGFKFLS